MDAPVRRLAAVLFADIVGYTGLSSENEDRALRLIRVFEVAVRQTLEAHGGRLVKLLGDGALGEFGSTEAAVRAAAELHALFRRRAASNGENAALRIGIHIGDVLAMPNGNVLGDGVNTAARLQAEAEPGQTAVSQDVWRQLRPRPEFRFRSLGERKLAGIVGAVWVFCVELASEAGAAPVDDEVPLRRRSASGRLLGLARIALLYIAASVFVLGGSALLTDRLELPVWIVPGALVLLGLGFVIMLTTAWIHSRPVWEQSVGERPAPWELDLPGLGQALNEKRLPPLTWPRAILGGVVAFTVLFAGAGGYVFLRGEGAALLSPGRASAAPPPGLAVLPLEVSGADRDVWGTGIVQLLAITLEGAGNLHVIDPPSVERRATALTPGDSTGARRIALDLGATYVLRGHVRAMGRDSVRVDARVEAAEDGRVLGDVRVDGLRDGVLSVAERIASGIVRQLGPARGRMAGDASALDQLGSTSVPAVRAYLAGDRSFRQTRWAEAKVAFVEAASLDPHFALARYRWALTGAWSVLPHRLGATTQGQTAAADIARLPERRALLVRGYAQLERADPRAIATLDSLTSRYPDDVEGWFLLGDAYYHLGSRAADSTLYERAFGRAIELDPSFGPAYLHPIEAAAANGDTIRTRRLIAAYRRADPGSPLLSGFDIAEDMARRQAAARPTSQPAGDRPTQPAAAAAPQRAAYEIRLRAADQARRDALRAGASAPTQPRFRDGERMREEAAVAATSGDYDRAGKVVESARIAFDEAAAAATWQSRVDSARAALAPLRAAARAGAERQQAVSLEQQAQQSGAQERYQQALRELADAADLYRRAGEPNSPVVAPAVEQRAPPASPAAVKAAAPAPAEGVRAALTALKAAIEAQDLDAVSAVWVGLSPDGLRGFGAFLRQMRDVTVRFDMRSLDASADGATVTVNTVYDFFDTNTRERGHSEFAQVFTMQPRDGRWVIVGSR